MFESPVTLPVGRAKLVSNLPGLYSGTHINKPEASRREAKRIDFDLDGPGAGVIEHQVGFGR